ncbi:Type IV secretory system Conjugative DNA transfer [Thermoactinomyces sp. DSM 45891]|uniref:type IV secretory system conjugative DNA transfer family protein n=1 Tax=Thermoactinomyces sp. DSM 45891 TaxID=1761907 RepID=UPI00091BA7FA|nr:type IV secretory system conjugative DNA transfer family protein [Thermoactinomyces sp. DSM 45891]SFX74482.1 Type IV secretory system Conjugative DNA transfer [Thermoactinomyces sp. DSM 45891]
MSLTLVDQNELEKTSGLLLGWDETYSKFVVLDESYPSNTMIVGKAASGKTTSYVIPNIIFEQEKSIVFFGSKKEVYDATKEKKIEQGYRVASFDFNDGYDFEDPKQVKEIFKEIVKESRSEKVVYYIGMPIDQDVFTKESIVTVYKELLDFEEDTSSVGNAVHLIFDDSNLYMDYDLLSEIVHVCRSYKVQVSLVIPTLHLVPEDKILALLGGFQQHVITGLQGTEKEIQLYKSLVGVTVSQGADGKLITVEQDQCLQSISSGKSVLIQLGSSKMVEVSQIYLI